MSASSIGLYLSNYSNKKEIIEKIMSNQFLIKHLDLKSLKGALYSSITINKFVEEENKHDQFIIQSLENKSLGSMSSGQQKIALLLYLISQKPDYMVLDDIYSNIDKTTQEAITIRLNELWKTTLLIQIFFRKRDILPNINKVIHIDENNSIINILSAKNFINKALLVHETHKFYLPEQYKENYIKIDPLIQMSDLSVHYGEKKVLNKINWTIKEGEFWHLVGPNGSGKSTILSLITGDNPRGYGQDMILFGYKKGSGESIWDIKRQIGYFTPSMIEQFKHDDTVENMIISGIVDTIGLYTKPTDLQRKIAKSWVDMLGNSYHNRMFQSLSLGQQRMVMVARAMVKHPPLLILDEPTIKLDDENSTIFIEMVNAIAAGKKIAILYVSHREEENLKPEKIFELFPRSEGSIGVVRE